MPGGSSYMNYGKQQPSIDPAEVGRQLLARRKRNPMMEDLGSGEEPMPSMADSGGEIAAPTPTDGAAAPMGAPPASMAMMSGAGPGAGPSMDPGMEMQDAPVAEHSPSSTYAALKSAVTRAMGHVPRQKVRAPYNREQLLRLGMPESELELGNATGMLEV